MDDGTEAPAHVLLHNKAPHSWHSYLMLIYVVDLFYSGGTMIEYFGRGFYSGGCINCAVSMLRCGCSSLVKVILVFGFPPPQNKFSLKLKEEKF